MPVDHLTEQGDDIFKFDFTKIRPYLFMGMRKKGVSPFLIPLLTGEPSESKK